MDAARRDAPRVGSGGSPEPVRLGLVLLAGTLALGAWRGLRCIPRRRSCVRPVPPAALHACSSGGGPTEPGPLRLVQPLRRGPDARVADQRWRRRHLRGDVRVLGLCSRSAHRWGRAAVISNALPKAWQIWPSRTTRPLGRSAPSSPGPAPGHCGIPGETRWRAPPTAGAALGEQRFIDAAIGEEAGFVPHLLAQGGPDQEWRPAPADLAQIAYGQDATLQNLLRTSDASGLTSFRKLAGIEAAWYFGNNHAGVQMYSPATGVTFDGLEADGRINHNSGAESTIEGLLSMLALDARPDVVAAATSRNLRTGQVTWKLVQAEAGTLKGRASVVTPASAWTGESEWSGGKYVELGPGGRVTVSATLPETGRYRLLPVFDRQEAPLRSVGTRQRVDSCRSASSGTAAQEPRGFRRPPATSISGTWAQTASSTPDRSRSSRPTSATEHRSPRCAAGPARDRKAAPRRRRRPAGRPSQLGDGAAPGNARCRVRRADGLRL